MELQKEQVSYNISLIDKRVVTQAGGDVIVPDTKPDMDELLRSAASVRITGIDITKGRMIIRGCADFSILYRPEGEPSCVQSISASFPFSHTEEHPDIAPGIIAPVEATLGTVSGRMQNSRKLSVQAEIFLALSCNKEGSAEVVSEICGENTATEYLTDSFEQCRPSIFTECPILLEETLEVPGGNPPIGEPHSMDIRLSPGDMKVIQNKIVWKGTATICTLYSSDDSSLPAATMEHEIALTEILDVDGVNESMICRLTPVVTDVSYRMADGGDGRRISILAKASIFVTAYEVFSTTVITDAYSPHKKFCGQTGSMVTARPVSDRVETISRREEISLDESELPLSRILDCQVTPIISHVDVQNGYLEMSGKLQLSFLYFSEDETLASINRELSIVQRIDSPHAKEHMHCDLRIVPAHLGYSLISREDMECRIVLHAEILLTEEVTIPFLLSAEEEDAPPENRPSIMICFAESGDSLWKIAKRYNISMDDLLAANDMDEGTPVTKGMQLLIPR